MDDESKQLLREIRDAVVRQEHDNRAANEQNMKTVRQQRTVVWLSQAAMFGLLAYVLYLKISGHN